MSCYEIILPKGTNFGVGGYQSDERGIIFMVVANSEEDAGFLASNFIGPNVMNPMMTKEPITNYMKHVWPDSHFGEIIKHLSKMIGSISITGAVARYVKNQAQDVIICAQEQDRRRNIFYERPEPGFPDHNFSGLAEVAPYRYIAADIQSKF